MTGLAARDAMPLGDDSSPATRAAPTSPGGWLADLRRAAAHPAVANTAWILLERIGRMGIALVVGVVVVRYLGAERYGLYAYTLTMAALFMPLAGCGIGENLIRHLVGPEITREKALGTACLLRAAAVTVAAVLTWTAFLVVPNNASATPWGLAAALMSISALPLMVLDPYFQSLSRSRVVTLCGLFAGITAAVIKVAAVLAAAPVTVFLAAHAAESILMALGLFTAYHLLGGRARRWSFDRGLAVTLVREGMPMILAGFAIMIYNQSDILLLGALRNDHDVGIYGAAVRLSTLWLFLPMAVLTSAAPFLYRAQNVDESLYASRLLKTTTIVVALCYLFALVMTIFPLQITTLLFGEEYAEAAPVLRIHVWSNIFAMLGMAQSTWYIGRGLLWAGLRNTVVGAVANLGLNLLVIPGFGPVGAAWTTLCATAIASVILNSLDGRTLPLARMQVQSLSLQAVGRLKGARQKPST